MSENQTKVSIVIPVHNEEKHLRETLQSIVNQSHTNWHAYILENCSNDSSLSIAREFETAYPNKITIHPTESLISSVQNLNRAFTLGIQTEYMCFLGGHDLWETNFLASCTQTMNMDQTIALSFPRGIWIRDEDGSVESLIPGFFDTRGLSLKNRIGTVLNSTPYAFQFYGLYRYKALLKIWEEGKFERYIVGVDIALLCEIAKIGNIVGIHAPNGNIRIRKCQDYGDWEAYFSKHGISDQEPLKVMWDTIKAFHESRLAQGNPRSPLNESVLLLDRYLWCLQSFMPALTQNQHLQDPDVVKIFQAVSRLLESFNEVLNCFPPANKS